MSLPSRRRSVVALATAVVTGVLGALALVAAPVGAQAQQLSGAASTTTAAPGAAGPAAVKRAEPLRPNIVIINTDDQRADSMAYLPKIRQWMGDGGTTYPNGYASIPSCCPSRASLMSGQYAHNNGQTTQQNRGLDLNLTIQRWLHDDGYFTGHAGKFIHWVKLGEAVPHWDRFTYFQGGYNNIRVNFDGTVRKTAEYSTNIVFDQAVDYIDDFSARDDGKPFFLQLTPIAPHLPSIPEPKYADAAVPAAVPDPSTDERDRSDKPLIVQRRNHPAAEVEATRQDMVRTLYSVDDGVDRLMKKLQASGELDNTLIVYTSDNGYALGEHRLTGKFLPYDQAYSVPFYIRWPGHVAAGAVDERPITHLDLAPTVLAAAWARQKGYAFDGQNVLSAAPRDATFVEYFKDDRNSKTIPTWATMKTGGYQYTEYFADDETTVTDREYYNLTRDPYMLVNLYGNKITTDDPEIAPLHDKLAQMRTCKASSCP